MDVNQLEGQQHERLQCRSMIAVNLFVVVDRFELQRPFRNVHTVMGFFLLAQPLRTMAALSWRSLPLGDEASPPHGFQCLQRRRQRTQPSALAQLLAARSP